MTEEEFSNENLAKTKDDEELYPVLVAEDGEVLDGKHRVEAKPKWHKKTVKAETRLDKIVVRLKAHYRRRIPREETQALVLEAAMELEKKGIAKEQISGELVKILPYNESYIRELLPLEYKQFEKVEAAEKGARLTEQKRRQIQNMTQIPECERCHIRSSTVKPEQINGKPRNLCDKCSQHAKLHLEEVVAYFRFLERAKEGKVPPKLTTTPKPTETWEYRKAQMTPQHSKMEEQIINMLSEKGVRGIVQNRSFCLLNTTPDIFFASENMAVYLDGKEVHANQTDRDEKLRETLAKRGVKVYSITYDSASQRETERVTQQILEWLGKKEV